MKTVISTIIPRKAKATNTANVKHKFILPYKKVGWPEGHKTLKANHKSKEGEANFKKYFTSLTVRKMPSVALCG